MKKNRAAGMLTLLIVGLVSLGLCLGAGKKKPETRASVEGGIVAGTIEDGLRVFKGIPFAAPPVGANRWRAPQPVVPWQGVRPATEYGPAPMQDRGTAMFFSGKLNVQVSEDCLYLNVWSPAKRDDEKLPVMVWIYGGGFNSGLTGSPLYDGGKLAKHGVVVVSVAYRVGAFGFLAHPELSRESGHGSGAYGFLDQIAGLRWVQHNIARFGGDPGNVTLFGESAGGTSVGTLAASPLAHGLFQRAICESGPVFAPIKKHPDDLLGTSTLAMAERKGEEFLSHLGAKDIQEARALSADTLQKNTAGMGMFPFTPSVDGYVSTDDPRRLFLQGKFNYTPTLIGTNSDDAGMFLPPGITLTKYREWLRNGFGDSADALMAAYPATTDAEAALATRHLLRDMTFGWGAWTWARLQSQHAPGTAYVYYFDRHSDRTPEGAGHGADVPYVFGYANPLFGGATPDDYAFSDRMQQYWTNFAKTGNPNGPGLTPWPTFRESDAKVLEFGKDFREQSVPNLKQLKVIEGEIDRKSGSKGR